MVKGRVAEQSAVGVLGGAGWCNRSGLGRERVCGGLVEGRIVYRFLSVSSYLIFLLKFFLL